MQTNVGNPFLKELRLTLPRLLSLFDTDKTSISYGYGDRFHWAWGLIDFSNGTFQGAVHGLARLWVNGLWPYETDKNIFLERLDSVFTGTAKMIRKDGSLEEAFPNEGSYCVTALVAFDLLCTLNLMENSISKKMRESWIAVIHPLINYIKRENEKHALISNHLAVAMAALIRWNKIINDKQALCEAEKLRDIILRNQSPDGWFEEYGGADPGYQSLCLNYLADVHFQKPDWNLLEPLKRSFEFLWYFAHPDGSFGGLYGSRYTRFYYPGGILALASEILEANTLSNFMIASIFSQKVITLNAIDEPNLSPLFNSYAWAASLYQQNSKRRTDQNIPAFSRNEFRHFFPDSGIFIDRGKKHYTIIAAKKGGVLYHFVDNKLKILNSGVVIKNKRGSLGSSKSHSNHNIYHNKLKKIVIEAPIVKMTKKLPKPYQFLIIRFMAFSLFRVPLIREIIKKILVKVLITRQIVWPCENKRPITLGAKLKIQDKTMLAKGYTKISRIKHFVPIHMASKGYWQVQDEQIR